MLPSRFFVNPDVDSFLRVNFIFIGVDENRCGKPRCCSATRVQDIINSVFYPKQKPHCRHIARAFWPSTRGAPFGIDRPPVAAIGALNWCGAEPIDHEWCWSGGKPFRQWGIGDVDARKDARFRPS